MKSAIKVIIFFLVVTFIAYLPFTSFLFALKNDAFTGYFPPKFFMSESLHAGYLPLWNPYINYGLPLYGDMSGGFWSPITWLIASTIGYNVYSFTLEEAFYIFMSGLGMYYLASHWKIHPKIRLLTGLAYMCSGYMVGHLQHFNWISGAAFLPWCLFTYLRALEKINLWRLMQLALAWSLFFCSAHPGLVIGSLYFFLLVGAAYYCNRFTRGEKPKIVLGAMAGQSLLFAFVILLFICGPIVGYLEVLPHISRAEKLSADTITGPATLQSWISVLLPLSITKNDHFFATDISIRNSYFGLLFLLMLLSGLSGKKTKWQWLLLGLALFFFLLSSDGVAKYFAINRLPLIGYVRLSGEFRIFTLFSIILFSAIQLNKIYTPQYRIPIRFYAYLLLTLLGIAMLFGLYHILFNHQSILAGSLLFDGTWRLGLKMLVDQLTIYDAILFQTICQIIFLTVIVYALKRNNITLLFRTVILEIIFATLCNIPYTGVGKASVREVGQIFKGSPRGIPVPVLQPTSKNDTLPVHERKMVGDWSFYNKQIGATHWVPYPINLNRTDSFFQHANLAKINQADYVYLLHGNPAKQSNIQVSRFTPGYIEISFYANQPDTLVYKQNYYPYWSANVNDQYAPVFASDYTFLSVPLVQGEQTVSFKFKNEKIVTLLYFNLFLFFGTCLVLMLRRKKYTGQH